MKFSFGAPAARRAFTGLALAAVAVLGACGGDDPTGSGGTTYNLVSLNGDTPPIVLFDDGAGNSATITGGNIVLLSGNRFKATTTGVTEIAGEADVTWAEGYSGTYTVDDDFFLFTATHTFDEDGSHELDEPATITGERNGRTLTVSSNAGIAIFQR